MVSTPEVFTDNIPIHPGPSMTVKKSSVIQSLCPFSVVLDVKQNNAVRRLGYGKSKYKAIIAVSMWW